MADGGTQYDFSSNVTTEADRERHAAKRRENEAAADRAVAEMFRKEELSREQALAASGTQGEDPNALTKDDNPTAPGMTDGPGGPEQGKPWEAGGGKTMESVDAAAQKTGGGERQAGGGSKNPAERAQQLGEGQAQAGATQDLAAQAEQVGQAVEAVKAEASKFTSKANHVLLQVEQNVLLAFDSATFGLTIPVTTLFRLPMAAFLAFQLRKVANGQKGGFFNLTADSFMPPGAEPPPLPPIFVYVAVMAYLMAVVFLALVVGGLLGLVVMSLAGQATILGQTFSFFKGFLGI